MNVIHMACLAQSAERKALNLVVVGPSPTVGVSSHTDKQQQHQHYVKPD